MKHNILNALVMFAAIAITCGCASKKTYTEDEVKRIVNDSAVKLSYPLLVDQIKTLDDVKLILETLNLQFNLVNPTPEDYKKFEKVKRFYVKEEKTKKKGPPEPTPAPKQEAKS